MARRGPVNAIRREIRRLPGRLDGLEQKARLTIGRQASAAYVPRLVVEASTWARDAKTCLRALGYEVAPHLEEEFESLLGSADRSTQWPDYFDTGKESARFLYFLVRMTAPKRMLETGVANGKSTSIILQAMDANGEGELHSIDMTRNVGQIFGGKHDRWTLHVTHGRAIDVKRVLEEIGSLDIFLHDADHSYKSQMREYELAEKFIAASGLLLSDDVDASWAFRDFCARAARPMGLLGDETKVFGFTRLND